MPNKTQPTNVSVQSYIETIENEARKKDAVQLIEIMSTVTGQSPILWGPSIVGFGSYHYIYASGREGDAPKVAFSARKQALVLYGLVFYEETHANNQLLLQLGTHKKGKGCLYIKTLNDINLEILKLMIVNSYKTKPAQTV